jgi:hypothetical protein
MPSSEATLDLHDREAPVVASAFGHARDRCPDSHVADIFDRSFVRTPNEIASNHTGNRGIREAKIGDANWPPC